MSVIETGENIPDSVTEALDNNDEGEMTVMNYFLFQLLYPLPNPPL